MRLDRIVAREVMPVADPQRFGQQPRRVVARPDVAHLAGSHQVIQRAQRFVEWRVPVRGMRLVEIDVVGIQAAQAVLDGAHDVLAAEALAVRPVPHARAHLGRDHDLVARPGAQPPADDALGDAAGIAGCPPAVDVRRVDEVDAGLPGAVEHTEGLLLGGSPAKRHRAQAQLADLQPGASQLTIFHDHPFLSVARDVDYTTYCGSKRPSPPAGYAWRAPGTLDTRW